MRTVLTLDEATALLCTRFNALMESERVPLDLALRRVLASDVAAKENIPDFVRATVDGYAVRACDTFGCCESIPALLTCDGEVFMGKRAGFMLSSGRCAYVPTGGELPEGADAMVMIEHTEDFGGGTIAVEKPAAPGQHLVFVGDDAAAGTVVLRAGRRLKPQDIGALAALGYAQVPVRKPPRVTILSTGDELVDVEQTPARGQVRDVNGPMLAAQCTAAGAQVEARVLVPDDEAALRAALANAAETSELLLLSGGSSVGVHDAAARLIESLGTLLFHGLSVKPGKPTLCGQINGVPVVGLPGHPVAAYFICRLLVEPALARMLGTALEPLTRQAELAAAVPSNHGREEYVPVRLTGTGRAEPVMGKSGLITTLSQADGFVRIPRDAEGIARGAQVTVSLWETL